MPPHHCILDIDFGHRAYNLHTENDGSELKTGVHPTGQICRAYFKNDVKGEKKCPYHITQTYTHLMRKPILVLCEQQRRTSDCASAQSDQRFCYSLSAKNNSYARCNPSFFNMLACLSSTTGRFVHNPVINREIQFFSQSAQLFSVKAGELIQRRKVHCRET